MYKNQKGQTKVCPFFFRDSSIVSFVIIFISSLLLYVTFTFDIVPPILNRGIQPATFPKALLLLIIILTLLIFYLSIKTPWKEEKKTSFTILYYTFIICFIHNGIKIFRFFFRYLTSFCFSFLLLGREKINIYFTCKYYISNCCFYIF